MNIERRIVVALLVAAASAPAAGQWQGWDYDYDREARSWREIAAQLPPHPTAGTLIAFDAGAATSHRFYIDAESISLGEDGVVRYTLVIKAAGGATNVVFEGMRCETREKKTYALGRSDGTWGRARNAGWRLIEAREFERHHNVLYREIFCRGKFPVESVKHAIQALKQGSVRVQD